MFEFVNELHHFFFVIALQLNLSTCDAFLALKLNLLLYRLDSGKLYVSVLSLHLLQAIYHCEPHARFACDKFMKNFLLCWDSTPSFQFIDILVDWIRYMGRFGKPIDLGRTLKWREVMDNLLVE